MKSRQGNKIGEIEELVINMATQKVHYAVLEFDPSWAAPEKFYAFPLSAFNQTGVRDDVVLDVDRSKIQAMKWASRAGSPTARRRWRPMCRVHHEPIETDAAAVNAIMPTDFECNLKAASTPLAHAWEHTVGSGRALLALRADWREHLRRARFDCGFRRMHFHGMLDDDMGTLICQNDKHLYSFSNIDSIFDYLLPIGMFVDFRGIRDAFMRERDLQEQPARHAGPTAIRDPQPARVRALRRVCWGITSSDGPGPKTLMVDGVERVFYDYIARGAPYGPDDGTLAPWALVASLPFAPEIVLPTIQNYERMHLKHAQAYGYKASFNPTFPVPEPTHEHGWVSSYHFGLNQGPIVLMIENHQSAFLWSLMRRCPYLVTGLRRAGFNGGWLE